jgi:DNA primase
MSHHDYSRDEIAQIKTSASMVEEFTKDGFPPVRTDKKGVVNCECPFCGGEDRCLIYPEATRDIRGQGDYFYCRQCERKGDILTYIKEARGRDFIEAIEDLDSRYKGGGSSVAAVAVAEPPASREAAPAAAPVAKQDYLDLKMLDGLKKEFQLNLLLDTGANEELHLYPNTHGARNFSPKEYLFNRGLKENTIIKYGLGFNPEWREVDGIDGDTAKVPPGITIPLYSAKAGQEYRLMGFQIKTYGMDSKYLRVGSGSYVLNYQSLTDPAQSVAVVPEGEFDCMILDQEIGKDYAVVTFGSTSGYKGNDLSEHFMAQKKVFWCFDNDAAGKNAFDNLMADAAGKHGNRYELLRMPAQSDVNDLMLDLGEEEFENYFYNQLPTRPFQQEGLNED